MVDFEKKAGKAPRRRDLDTVGLGALALLVVGLGVVVWLALPKEEDLRPNPDAGASVEGVADPDPPSKPRTPASLERLGEASVELAILTKKTEEEASKLATGEALAELLEARHCGKACDAVKKQLRDHEHFEIEVVKSEDYILPPKDTWSTVAAGLTPAERASIGTYGTTFVVRTRGPADDDQIPARAGFAATLAAAEALSGLVYDEVTRRIVTQEQFAGEVSTVSLGQSMFLPKQIVVQLYRQDDGTARLLTLGMVRFGSPDFMMRGAPMELGPALANVLNVVCSQAASAATELRPITLADVARVSGHTGAELAKDPLAASPVKLETADAERIEGDPENEMLEIVPVGGATREAWSSVATDLFGATPKIVFAGKDAELDAIAVRARATLPGAVKRLEHGEGTLYLKAPFPIPADARPDGGATEEWLWMQATVCDAKVCAGLLSNTPGYATNLAAGKDVTIPRDKTADWLLRSPDGGATGGASIEALQKRGAR